MPTSRYVHTLADGPLDLIGDVHGEIDALEHLLNELGWGQGKAPHPEGRTLVFVGDLVDRGPDSPAVVRRVRELVEAGHAQCVLGNHELAIIRDDPKPDNRWLRSEPFVYKTGDLVPQSGPGSAQERRDIIQFFDSFPLVLQRDDLRVVHAAWSDDDVATLLAAGDGDLNAIYQDAIDQVKARLGADRQRAWQEHQDFAAVCRKDLDGSPPDVPRLAQAAGMWFQNANPIKHLTSGEEAPLDRCFPSNGKWRYLKRIRWWDAYTDDIPVVIGHYWRDYPPAPLRSGAATYETESSEDEQALFPGTDLVGPVGPKKNVWCVDYSVGRRFVQRLHSDLPVPNAEFRGRLAALRWPERQIVFDDGERWGG